MVRPLVIQQSCSRQSVGFLPNSQFLPNGVGIRGGGQYRFRTGENNSRFTPGLDTIKHFSGAIPQLHRDNQFEIMRMGESKTVTVSSDDILVLEAAGIYS